MEQSKIDVEDRLLTLGVSDNTIIRYLFSAHLTKTYPNFILQFENRTHIHSTQTQIHLSSTKTNLNFNTYKNILYLYTIQHNPYISQRPQTHMWHLHTGLVVHVSVPKQLGTRLVKQQLYYHWVYAGHDTAIKHVGVETACNIFLNRIKKYTYKYIIADIFVSIFSFVAVDKVINSFHFA